MAFLSIFNGNFLSISFGELEGKDGTGTHWFDPSVFLDVGILCHF
jgi:hypothetical protein